MYAITLNGLYWNREAGGLTETPTRFTTAAEAAEAAQEDAAFPPTLPWSVVPVPA